MKQRNKTKQLGERGCFFVSLVNTKEADRKPLVVPEPAEKDKSYYSHYASLYENITSLLSVPSPSVKQRLFFSSNTMQKIRIRLLTFPIDFLEDSSFSCHSSTCYFLESRDQPRITKLQLFNSRGRLFAAYFTVL